MSHSLEQNAAPARAAAGSGSSPPQETSRLTTVGNGQSSVPSLWQELVVGASPRMLQDRLLAAGPEEILYAHTLRTPTAPRSHVVADILAGRLDLVPHASAGLAAELEWQDQALDDAQREAVSQALSSPDLFLIQGSPGTGKTRVVAEIITQAARRGERVLVLSAGKGALDRLLGLLDRREEVLAVRCVGPQEDLSRLPAEASRNTYAARSRSFAGDILRRAEQRCRSAELQTEQAHRDRDLAMQLRPLAEEWEKLETDSRAHLARRQRIGEQIEQETANDGVAELQAQFAAEGARHRQSLESLQRQQSECDSAYRHADAEHQRWVEKVTAQDLLLAARTQRRWFTLRYWLALFQGRPDQRLEEFKQRAVETGQALRQAEACLLEVKQQSEFEVQRHQSALAQIRQAEVNRRQADLDVALEKLHARQRELERDWASLRTQLANPAGLTDLPGFEAAEALIQQVAQREHIGRRAAAFAKDWLSALGRISDQLPERFPEAVNLVLATPADIVHDAAFGDRAAARPFFDVLIVEQADRWTESELLAHVGRAKRCILVGQTPLAEALRAAASESAAPNRTIQRHFGAFHRLWNALHLDPRRLPYQWVEDAQRLTCRLQAIRAEHRSRLEVERLVDHPDVELHILAIPPAAPALAEVVFPADKFTILTAKAYLYQQLGELTLRPTAATLRWRSDDGALCLDTSDEAAIASAGKLVTQRVELEDGVCEIVAGGHGDNGRLPQTWATLRLEFDSQKGWDRSRAEGWLRERGGLGSLGRTVLLERPYRGCRAIADTCSQVLCEPAPRQIAQEGSMHSTGTLPAGVQCLSVPYQRERLRPRAHGPQRSKPPPTKSFEIDLSDAKQRQRVPIDLQLKLPAKGLVNFAEAQAIIHWLDQFARGPELGGRSEPVSIAVLSWQTPQVQFLQSLWAGAAGHPAICVRFETVAGFRDHEADIVLLSLCRSNAQRVVGFADYPEDWRWALTCARTSMVIFGDPETLSRRAHWTGAVNRQTELSAAAERLIVQRLLPHFVSTARRSTAPQGART